jgi:hypothetical protein
VAQSIRVTGLFPQEYAPGSSPLSSTRPDCTTSHPAANPCKTGVFSCAGKAACGPVRGNTVGCCTGFCTAFERWSSTVVSAGCTPGFGALYCCRKRLKYARRTAQS